VENGDVKVEDTPEEVIAEDNSYPTFGEIDLTYYRKQETELTLINMIKTYL